MKTRTINTNVNNSNNKLCRRNVITGLLIITIFLSLPVLCKGHGDHYHDNSGKPASFKYSREANEEFINEQHSNEHVHHEHHSHGSNHDDSHKHHHHNHDHGHHHNHDHGHHHNHGHKERKDMNDNGIVFLHC